MVIQKLLNKKLPVLYRWARRRRYFPHAVVLCCAIIVLPVGIIGGARLSHVIASNQAMAATRALVPEHSVYDKITPKERKHYAAALKSLVSDDPQKLHQLIGEDIRLMLDEPELQRAEGNTVSWHYRAADCVLDIYFERAEEGPGAVLHYEVRQRKIAAFAREGVHEDEFDTTRCLEQLYRQKAA